MVNQLFIVTLQANMARKIGLYIMTLAGIVFLLHVVVPHHHHADFSSFIEHEHIIEHLMGMHDDAEEEHHQHKEHVLNEPVLASKSINNETSCHYCAPQALLADAPSVPQPRIITLCAPRWESVKTVLPVSHHISRTLRGPPSVA